MWNLRRPSQSPARSSAVWRVALATSLLAGAALLAGCGASAATSAGSAGSSAQSGQSFSSSSNSSSHTSTGSGVAYGPAAASTPSQQSSQSTPQYLIKSLNVTMTMPDTRATATDLQNWITSTDPKAQSAGANYSNVSDQYNITLTFSVEASYYPQIESYLAGYAAQHKGKLISLNETVQDVTNDYVDSQSRLANLRTEQGRLQTLMGRASSLADVLTIEQRLTDVEGQIEQIEAHLNQLSGQTTFYTIQIQLLPIATYKSPTPQPWNPGGVFHDALSSAQTFGEGLLTLLIWLGVYAIYIVPIGVIVWLAVRYQRRRAARLATPITPTTSSAPPVA